jgi:hypothetical protein
VDEELAQAAKDKPAVPDLGAQSLAELNEER